MVAVGMVGWLDGERWKDSFESVKTGKEQEVDKPGDKKRFKTEQAQEGGTFIEVKLSVVEICTRVVTHCNVGSIGFSLCPQGT